MFSINYTKNKNTNLFKSITKVDENFIGLQNYNPIYNLYFSLNETNWNSINLNEKHNIIEIITKTDDNNYTVLLNTGETKETFFKLSPLIDPVRFLSGKLSSIAFDDICVKPTYDENHINNYKNTMESEETLFNISKNILINKKHHDYVNNKINNPYNTGYTEALFTYLSSQLLNKNGFIHGIDYYGSYTCIKQNFILNIADDIDVLQDSTFFYENYKNNLIKLDEDYENIINFDTRKHKQCIKLNNTKSVVSIDSDIDFDGLFINNKNDISNNSNLLSDICDLEKYMYNLPQVKIKNTSGGYRSSMSSETSDNSDSSNSSGTSDSSENSGTTETSETSDNSESTNKKKHSYDSSHSIIPDKENYNDEWSNYDSDEYSSDEYSCDEEYIGVTIKKVPIIVIASEQLNNTLDFYMMNNKISDKEWVAILLQIIMTLLTYQKVFNFTHNDLHTNNVMYNTTDKLFIYYKFNNHYYKVPTYGKIYKIIDFGRAIYKYNNKVIMCDAYNIDEDAYGQYNYGPFIDNNKPRIEPNFSFDLTRLACSLFDHFMPDETAINEYSGIIEDLIKEWVTDDDGKLILYKSNGKERYPGFKLYKVIAKNVHKHTPEKQLTKEIFRNFRRLNSDTIKEIEKSVNPIFIDIDSMTQMT